MADDEPVPDPEEVPSTLQRSEPKAQRTYVKAKDSAYETREDGQYAKRVAWSAVKHSYAKVGDHWEPKDEKGPSDQQAEQTGAPARKGRRDTAGGVDAGASKATLYDQAKRLGIDGRSKMDKDELVEALRKASERETARARNS